MLDDVLLVMLLQPLGTESHHVLLHVHVTAVQRRCGTMQPRSD
jgi:hypothetical protein